MSCWTNASAAPMRMVTPPTIAIMLIVLVPMLKPLKNTG